MIRFSFILDSLFCLPNRCGLYNGPESFLTLGRSFDPWPVFRLLVNLLSFCQFPDSWSMVWLLFILLNLGRSSDSWSIDPDLNLTLSIGFLIQSTKRVRLWSQFDPIDPDRSKTWVTLTHPDSISKSAVSTYPTGSFAQNLYFRI